MDDFSHYPKSVNEVRGERSGKGADWSPRDLLVHMLRQIDSGEMVITDCVVVYRRSDADDDQVVGYRNASRDGLTAVGLLSAGQFMLQGER